MPKAYGALTSGASNATERLAAKDKPTGKAGNPALTVKVRNMFSAYKSENVDDPIQWEDWLAKNPNYGLGDNGHVYKK